MKKATVLLLLTLLGVTSAYAQCRKRVSAAETDRQLRRALTQCTAAFSYITPTGGGLATKESVSET